MPVLISWHHRCERCAAARGPIKTILKLLDTRPAIGTVLNQGDYENFKKSLTNIALRKGYFDKRICKAQLGITLGLHKAFWDIDYNSGRRYRFRHVTLKRITNPR